MPRINTRRGMLVWIPLYLFSRLSILVFRLKGGTTQLIKPPIMRVIESSFFLQSGFQVAKQDFPLVLCCVVVVIDVFPWGNCALDLQGPEFGDQQCSMGIKGFGFSTSSLAFLPVNETESATFQCVNDIARTCTIPFESPTIYA